MREQRNSNQHIMSTYTKRSHRSSLQSIHKIWLENYKIWISS